MAKALSIFVTYRWNIFKQACGVKENVIKVHSVAGDDAFLIFYIHTLYNFITISLRGVIVRADQFILGARDRGMDAGGAVQLLVEVQLPDHGFYDPPLSCRIKDHQ